MSILDPSTAALTILTEDPFFDEGQVAAAAFLARYSGRTLDAYRYDLRCFFQRAGRPLGCPRSQAAPHRAVPSLDGGEKARSLDDRPAIVDGLWLLSLRPHRRAGSSQSSPIRPPTESPPLGRSRARPPRVRDLSLHRGALRP